MEWCATCFLPYLPIWCGAGGSPKGPVHNVLMQFVTPGSKNQNFVNLLTSTQKDDFCNV